MSRGVVRVGAVGCSAAAPCSRAWAASSAARSVSVSDQASNAAQSANPVSRAIESMSSCRFDPSTVPVSPSRAAVALTASSPTRSRSASVQTLSLTVSISTGRSRTDTSTSSRNNENPVGPGVRRAAASRTRSSGSSRPSARRLSASRATSTLITEAGTTGSSASSPTSCCPSSVVACRKPRHPARPKICSSDMRLSDSLDDDVGSLPGPVPGVQRVLVGQPGLPPRAQLVAASCNPCSSMSRSKPRASRTSRGASTHTRVVMCAAKSAEPAPTPSSTSRSAGETSCHSASCPATQS